MRDPNDGEEKKGVVRVNERSKAKYEKLETTPRGRKPRERKKTKTTTTSTKKKKKKKTRDTEGKRVCSNGAEAKEREREEVEGKGRAAVHRCVWKVRGGRGGSPWKFTGARVTGNLAVAARS
ncbi:hypothetical protein K0M31_015088 [Melipona bicolor]|uniref:Uncharacterized protein n=1 Tax=Melipona bicolor TaxID=60889 RepID=A0AA40KFM2_9HYME|nr:hypothetical protein K0M31_015088 [Melipona bicolor]